jgi:hypothetical protein
MVLGPLVLVMKSLQCRQYPFACQGEAEEVDRQLQQVGEVGVALCKMSKKSYGYNNE